MERISQLKTPSDCLAIVEQPRHRLSHEALRTSLILALDGVQNPGNVGTIVRLADWFGVEDILCSKECADIYNPKVVQATMGALLRVRVHYVDNLAEILSSAAKEGTPIYGTLLDGNNIYSETLAKRGIIVMGNEGQGVSEECRKSLTHKLFIPPYPADRPTSESLNVAMATGIILAEFRRAAK
jgi:TrmH family RNA methyltransferase